MAQSPTWRIKKSYAGDMILVATWRVSYAILINFIGRVLVRIRLPIRYLAISFCGMWLCHVTCEGRNHMDRLTKNRAGFQSDIDFTLATSRFPESQFAWLVFHKATRVLSVITFFHRHVVYINMSVTHRHTEKPAENYFIQNHHNWYYLRISIPLQVPSY